MSPITSFPSAAVRPPSPLRKLGTLLLRLIDRGSLEGELADEYLTEAHTGLDTCHAASSRTETIAERFRRDMAKAWADKVITPREQRILARDQRALAQAAKATTKQIESLR